MDVIGRHGTVEAAYPPELLSIEAYTKGKLKPGDVLNAENVDIVKDLLDPGAYYQIKHDGRLVDLAPTETDVTRLTPTAVPAGHLEQQGQAQDLPRRQPLYARWQAVDRRQSLPGAASRLRKY